MISEIQSLECLNTICEINSHEVECNHHISIFLPDNEIFLKNKNKNLPGPGEKSLEKEGTQKEKRTSASLSRAEPGRECQTQREVLHLKGLCTTRGAKLEGANMATVTPLKGGVIYIYIYI